MRILLDIQTGVCVRQCSKKGLILVKIACSKRFRLTDKRKHTIQNHIFLTHSIFNMQKSEEEVYSTKSVFHTIDS